MLQGAVMVDHKRMLSAGLSDDGCWEAVWCMLSDTGC